MIVTVSNRFGLEDDEVELFASSSSSSSPELGVLLKDDEGAPRIQSSQSSLGFCLVVATDVLQSVAAAATTTSAANGAAALLVWNTGKV